MKKLLYISFVFSLIAFMSLSSCSSGKYADSTDLNEQTRGYGIENPDALVHLSDHLRKVSGVRVEGQGDDARIFIQGIKTFEGSTDPLYILDGQQFSGSFGELAQLVNSVEIKSIQVLKDPSSLARYGVQGTNGVIKIDLKK